MEGVVYLHLSVPAAFESAYVTRFGNDYQIAYAVNAYDMAVLIGTLFNKVSTVLSPEQIMAELKSAKSTLPGVTGAFRFQHTDDGDSFYQFPVQLKVIEGGRFHPLK